MPNDESCPHCNKGEIMVWTRPNGNFVMCDSCDYMESYTLTYSKEKNN